MQLKGKKISHVKFGPGVVADVEENVITVAFAKEEKKFLFPGAFSHFLTLEDKDSQTRVEQLLRKINRERENRRQAENKEHDRQKKLHQLKVAPNSQAAFGFVENRREDVFSAWTVCAGHYVGGYSKGKPRVPIRLKPNSACLFTQCEPDTPELGRRIIGAFMVKDDFNGTSCVDGIIPGHEKYRIALETENTLLYWHYFAYQGQPPKWGNTEMKYFSNLTMQRILYEMQNAVPNGERRAATEFYRYFCTVNRLSGLAPEQFETAAADNC